MNVGRLNHNSVDRVSQQICTVHYGRSPDLLPNTIIKNILEST